MESESRPSLRKLLLHDGFEEHFVGTANPPASCFRKEIGDVNVELEFLTPQIGAVENETLRVQTDLAAQALRYSDILLEDPLLARIREPIDGRTAEIEIYVPRPAAFIFQKGLAFTKRLDSLKKAKDLYYLFDIIAGYPEMVSEIEQGMATFKTDRPAWFRKFVSNLDSYFIVDGATGPRMIVEQRSTDAYNNLNDDQLEQFCRSKISEFVSRIY